MKKIQIGCGAVLTVALLFSSVSDAGWVDDLFESGDLIEQLEIQLFERDGIKMLDRYHGGIVAPAGWEKMSISERRNIMKGKNGVGNDEMKIEFEKMEREFEMVLPDGWVDMSPQERRQYRFENTDEMRMARNDSLLMKIGTPEEKLRMILDDAGIAVPENFVEMSADDLRDFFEENGLEIPTSKIDKVTEIKDDNLGMHMSAEKQVRNFLRKAEKGKHFKKFTGQLKPRKRFGDEGQMRNPMAVAFMQQRGIMEGYEDGTFGADQPINRVETLKVLLESLGIAPVAIGDSGFNDVDEDAWYSGYVKAAKRRGFVAGYEDGTFKPDRTVNQAELLKLAFESFGIDLTDYEVTDLPEGIDKDAWFARYLQYALNNDLLDVEDVNLGEGMNREMFAEVISRLIKQQEALGEEASVE